MSIDPRILEIGLEVNGELRVYRDAAMSAKIVRSADPKQNTCDVTIAGLLPEVRNFLITECSPWNPNRKDRILTVSAGRVSTGAERIYTGGVSGASATQPPDVTLSLKALTSENVKYKFVNYASAPTAQLSKLAAKVADDCGVSLRFEATDKTVSNYLYNGSAARQVAHLALIGDVDAFVDNDRLVVKNLGERNKGQARLINLNTQMIGIPVVDDTGIKVRVLFDPTLNVGDAVQIESTMNPAANGEYVIYKMAISLSNFSQDWYVDLSCNNANIRSIAAKRAAADKAKAKSDAEKKKDAESGSQQKTGG